MNSLNWQNIYDLVVPYPDVQSINLTPILLKNNYTTLKMFQVSYFRV
jgi:hypothetical protein